MLTKTEGILTYKRVSVRGPVLAETTLPWKRNAFGNIYFILIIDICIECIDYEIRLSNRNLPLENLKIEVLYHLQLKNNCTKKKFSRVSLEMVGIKKNELLHNHFLLFFNYCYFFLYVLLMNNI